jgi:hypothetical protein
MRLFKQSPSRSLSDGIPSIDDTPGNFYLSTVNFQSSPFRSRFNKVWNFNILFSPEISIFESYYSLYLFIKSGYDSDGYTPTQVIPQKIKGKRKRAHQSEYSVAPRFNISKAGQNLFDDGEGLYIKFHF